MKENSIEETIKQLKLILKVRKEQKEIIECAGGSCINCDPDIRALIESIDILSDYKRVLKINEVLLKENEMYKRNSEIMSKENLSTAEQLKVEIKENFRLKNQLENNRKEYQETYKDVREELKELKKENKELKEDRDKFKKELLKRITYCNELEKDLFENGSNYVISKQKVKDKIADKIAEIEADKLNYGEDDWYLESELKGYAIDKLKELELQILESEE